MMKVGFIQNNPVFGAKESNLARIVSVLAEASADLFVLPELFATGYQFKDRAEAFDLAETVPDGTTCTTLVSLAKNLNAHIVGGFAERDGDKVYNSALLASPKGLVATYRKAHLFDREKEVFDPGDSPLQVHDIGIARIGIMICFDWRFPETARTLALQGADLIAHPANLVLKHCPEAMITRCLENQIYVVTADRVGREERIDGETLDFIGQSQVVDPHGHVLYRASRDQEEIQVVSIDLDKARDKFLNARNHLFEDRREDLYRLE